MTLPTGMLIWDRRCFVFTFVIDEVRNRSNWINNRPVREYHTGKLLLQHDGVQVILCKTGKLWQNLKMWGIDWWSEVNGLQKGWSQFIIQNSIGRARRKQESRYSRILEEAPWLLKRDGEMSMMIMTACRLIPREKRKWYFGMKYCELVTILTFALVKVVLET